MALFSFFLFVPYLNFCIILSFVHIVSGYATCSTSVTTRIGNLQLPAKWFLNDNLIFGHTILVKASKPHISSYKKWSARTGSRGTVKIPLSTPGLGMMGLSERNLHMPGHSM